MHCPETACSLHLFVHFCIAAFSRSLTNFLHKTMPEELVKLQNAIGMFPVITFKLSLVDIIDKLFSVSFADDAADDDELITFVLFNIYS